VLDVSTNDRYIGVQGTGLNPHPFRWLNTDDVKAAVCKLVECKTGPAPGVQYARPRRDPLDHKIEELLDLFAPIGEGVGIGVVYKRVIAVRELPSHVGV
jgi:hypothetical protein